ncbi:hypothetical protein [Sphingopyxis terrae]|nr:hypothetical protein [Sphingopyxis terrae]PCF91062.1 hypothetical protein CPA46_11475 [Sphingopyxis terrae subsp. ummariensis]
MTHVTDAYRFRDIMAGGALAPAPCRIFGSELVYLFYGRPAYRATAEMESNGSDAYWPICFVLEPGAVTPARIYPFDSGAFHHGRFKAFMHHQMIKEDFELEIDPSSPGRLLRLFWRDEKSYFNADGASDFVPDPIDFETKAYRDLISYRGRGNFDERGSAIEIQSEAPVTLKGNTIAVILPSEFATDAIVARIEQDFGALALPFDVVRRHGPTEAVGQIYTIVRDLLGGAKKDGRGKCW